MGKLHTTKVVQNSQRCMVINGSENYDWEKKLRVCVNMGVFICYLKLLFQNMLAGDELVIHFPEDMGTYALKPDTF